MLTHENGNDHSSHYTAEVDTFYIITVEQMVSGNEISVLFTTRDTRAAHGMWLKYNLL